MSTRPPPAGAPPSYAFVARVYRRPLRPVVMAVTILAAVWSFMWGISALMDVSGSGTFKPIDISLGTMYLVIGIVELFGFFAAFRQNIALVRLYAFLSTFDAVLVLASESIRFATYFTHKQPLIDACNAGSISDLDQNYGSFWGVYGSSDVLTSGQAAHYCSDAWGRAVWSAAAWLVIASLLSWFFVSVAFSYYHQLLSPQPLSAPSTAFRMGPSTAFSPPSDPYNPQAGYQYPAQGRRPEDWVPPYDPAKLPGYGDSRTDLHSIGDTKAKGQLEEEELPREGGRSIDAATEV